MPKWAVLVVHGVGETGPGATVDAFVPSLAAASPQSVHPDGSVEVLWLRPDVDPPPAAPPLPQEVPPEENVVFPVHVRRATLTAPGGGPVPGGSPDQAVFAEVYWADLSRIREGLLHSVLALFSTIFLIRFIPDRASVMPDEPRTPSADRARWWARWLRAALYASALLLNGPIAAFGVLLTCVLLLDHVVLPAFSIRVGPAPALPAGAPAPDHMMEISPGTHAAALLAVGVVAALGGLRTWFYGNRRKWGSTWTRFWGSFALVALLYAAAIAVHQLLSTDAQARAVQALAGWIRYTPPTAEAVADPAHAAAPIPYLLRGPILLLAGVQAVFVVICLIVVPALIPWAIARWNAEPRWRPALAVAYGTALLQIALWMLVAPGLTLLAVASLVSDAGAKQQLRQLFEQIESGFAMFLIFALLIGFFAYGVWWRRSRWAEKHKAGFVVPHPVPDIDRLIVNVLILGALIVLTASACGYSIASAFDLISPGRFPASWAGVFAVPLFALILGYFRKGLGNWLHIITDIINHFYRRRDRFPKPWGPEDRPEPTAFKIQQQIEARFRAVLKQMLDDPAVTRLSVVCHSQGTVITVDVFSLASMSRRYRKWLIRRLRDVGRLHLVTMGSPVTHLYQYYFPDRYPPLSSSAWRGLRATVATWVNAYRIDDYIGTYIEVPPAGRPDPNLPIQSGGHTEYWTQRAVFEAIRQKEPQSLPG